MSYNDKHNEANGEDNRDGTDDNQSWNCGVEGPTTKPSIVALRERQKRNMLATLLLSQGVPMLSQVKLIAEPWDLGEGGYQVGNFPAGWAEWNAKYRDTIRRYWKGDGGQVAELGFRLSGSSDL